MLPQQHNVNYPAPTAPGLRSERLKDRSKGGKKRCVLFRLSIIIR